MANASEPLERSGASDSARLYAPPQQVDMVVYHKNCPDGYGAAWAAWFALVKNGGREDVLFYAASHGDDTAELEGLVRGRHVACFDFSFPKSTVDRILAAAVSFFILDHHKSAVKEHAGAAYAHFDMLHSGAVLSWWYFFDWPPPQFLLYIEDKDIWKWEMQDSKAFSAGLELVPQTFECYSTLRVQDHVSALITRGKALLEQQTQVVERLAKGAEKVKLQKEVSVNVCNAGVWVSELGNLLARDASFALVWRHNHKKECMNVCLRSLGFDVSHVASLYGGGGHCRAAGFQWNGNIEELLADLSERATLVANVQA